MKKARSLTPLSPLLVTLLFALAAPAAAQSDMASRFGQRAGVLHMSMSPDGRQVAVISAARGGGTALMLVEADEGAKARVLTGFNGDPDYLRRCNWASNSRLVCTVSAVLPSTLGPLPVSRVVSIDTGSGKIAMLSTRQTSYSTNVQLFGGGVIDWLPDEEDAILMGRVHIPEAKAGTRLAASAEGFGVDRVDTRSGRVTTVEAARREARSYLTDGRGNVRVMSTFSRVGATEQLGSRINWFYRPQGSRGWEKLGESDQQTGAGIWPVAVDHELNAAYALRKIDGRDALVRIRLEPGLAEEVLVTHPEVDVDGLIRIGRRNRVVGASYATDRRYGVYFDEGLDRLKSALGRALPGNPQISIVDSSLDEKRLLIRASRDQDPGAYYILDRDTNRLTTFLVSHPALEGMTLAQMRPVTYRATDGTTIPAYLTLPPGKERAKGLPAIVMPHGGPSARDEWGFDWLPQYFAARGYAVLQPNFRGSAGYGEEWLQVNGFQSWRTAIGDVRDAGRWLVNEGIADPKRLAIVGWSYGGYAALQSAATEPDLFRAVVAIAPVTDLALLIEDSRGWTDRALTRDFIGTGPHLTEGSPAQNAASIQAPVLLVHGALDRNVGIGHSRRMASRLASAGKTHEMITFEKLDHALDDSDARTRLLRESDAFLQRAFGSTATASAD